MRTDGDDHRQHVHEWEELHPQDKVVEERGQSEGEDDGEAGEERKEEGVGEEEHAEDDQPQGDEEEAGVRHQVLVEERVLEPHVHGDDLGAAVADGLLGHRAVEAEGGRAAGDGQEGDGRGQAPVAEADLKRKDIL